MLKVTYLAEFRKKVTAPAPNEKIYQNYFEDGKRYFSDVSFGDREVLAVEKELSFKYAGKEFIGFLDLMTRDQDGRVVITDHKSRKLKPRSNRKKPTQSDLELDEYLRQLYVYSSAVKQLYGFYPDVLEFNCFRSGVLIQEPFDLDKCKEVESWAENLIDTITNTEDWYPNEDYWFCRHLCDAYDECEYID